MRRLVSSPASCPTFLWLFQKCQVCRDYGNIVGCDNKDCNQGICFKKPTGVLGCISLNAINDLPYFECLDCLKKLHNPRTVGFMHYLGLTFTHIVQYLLPHHEDVRLRGAPIAPLMFHALVYEQEESSSTTALLTHFKMKYSGQMHLVRFVLLLLIY